MKTTHKLWIGIGILAVISPIGLFLPKIFKAGSAWGEWTPDEVKGLVGFVPEGLKRVSSVWNALMPDYAFKGWENQNLAHLSISYIISAIVGILLCVGAAYLLGKLLAKKGT